MFFFNRCSTAPLKVGRCRFFCPWGFVPQGKLFFCPWGFFPQGKIFFVTRVFIPQGKLGQSYWCCACQRVKLFFCPLGFAPQGKLFVIPRGFVPQGNLGQYRWCRACQQVKLFFCPWISSPRRSSFLFLGVLFTKGSWDGVNVAALASRCRTAIKGRWAIRQSPPTIRYRPMKADVRRGLYTLLPVRGRRADVSDLYWMAPSGGIT